MATPEDVFPARLSLRRCGDADRYAASRTCAEAAGLCRPGIQFVDAVDEALNG